MIETITTKRLNEAELVALNYIRGWHVGDGDLAIGMDFFRGIVA